MGGASSASRAAKREDDFPADKATAITAGVSPMVLSKDGGKDASLTSNVAALHRMPTLTGSIRRRIALFGGSFDPITNVHLDCAAAVIQHRTCDEVWLVPCGPRPDKPSLKTPSADRVSMTRLAVEEYFPSHWPISVCDAEANLPGALPTIELLELLQAQKPEVDFYFAIGTDLVKQVPEWPPDGPRLARDFNFLIIPRAGEAFNPSSIPLHWKCLETVKGTSMVESNMSSTELRRRLAVCHGETKLPRGERGRFDLVHGMIQPRTLQYIIEHDLYTPLDREESELVRLSNAE